MGRNKSSYKRKKSLPELNENARRFRWEFLRRNPWFQEESKRIIDDTKAVLRMSRKNLKAFNEATDEVLDATMDFSKKWGLAYGRGDRYPSPRKDYNRLKTTEKALIIESITKPSTVTLDSVVKKYVTAGCVPIAAFRGIRKIKGTILDPRNPKGVWIRVSPSTVRFRPGWVISEVAMRLYARDKKIKSILKDAKDQYASEFAAYPVQALMNRVHLEIDMNAPKTKILRDVAEIIESVLRLRQDRGLSIINRPPYESYPEMLKTYDAMINNSKISFHTLYRKVNDLPKDAYVSEGQANAIRKSYVRACKIIKSDFRNIR